MTAKSTANKSTAPAVEPTVENSAPEKPAPVQAVVSSEAVSIPSQTRAGAGRPAQPNPYTDLVAALAGDREHARTLTFNTPAGEARDEAVKKAAGFLNRAGAALDTPVTIRKVETVSEDGNTLTMTVWATDKVSRKSKDGETKTDEQTTNDGEKPENASK